MTTPTLDPATADLFEVRFRSLFVEGRCLAFPCDASGRVDMDRLPRRARDNYLFARALIGREFSWPRVCARPSPGA